MLKPMLDEWKGRDQPLEGRFMCHLGYLGKKIWRTAEEMGRNGKTRGVIFKMNVMLLELSRKLNNRFLGAGKMANSLKYSSSGCA